MAYHSDKILPFWGGKFSQWAPSKIELFDVEFNCAEQAMMFGKAAVFKDAEILRAIMKENHPSKQKKLGRQVENFDTNMWEAYCIELVTCISYAKFTQNDNYREYLNASGTKWIVEASPYDKVWGVGLAENDSKIWYPEAWDGKNYLGECIMNARDIINGRSDSLQEHMDHIEELFDYGKEVLN